MIDLQLKAAFETRLPPFVVKLRVTNCVDGIEPAAQEALVASHPGRDGTYDCRAAGRRFVLYAEPEDSVDGDVILCMPSRGTVQRLFRRSSRHNTLLLTERCDQVCVMCSQPPKNTNDEWRFPFYEEALLLADENTIVGISGGEPTLYKDALLAMIDRVATRRPDLSYHILSNGQHFTPADEALLRNLHARVKIIWGIPLYSHSEAVHDKIVGKDGAFRKVMPSLFGLAGTGAQIELRTVITALNIFDLPHMARFIGRHIPFIAE